MKTDTPDLIEGLPGSALIREGLADHRSGRQTIAACLVRIASPRLSRAGLILFMLLIVTIANRGEGDRWWSFIHSIPNGDKFPVTLNTPP